MRASLAITLLASALVGGAGTASVARAETGTSTTSTSTAAPQLVPPRALTPTEIAIPEGAPPFEAPIEVLVRIRVDENGHVTRVDLVRSGGVAFDDAALEAASLFRFEPATYGGVPVPVDINFTARFAPPVVASAPAGTATAAASRTASSAVESGVLAGRIQEKGTRLAVSLAAVVVTSAGRRFVASAGEDGRFEIELPPGEARVEIAAQGYLPFLQKEQIAAREELSVAYLIERERYSPYEVVVVGKADRTEIARSTLRGPEIAKVPGTFGDPFRVIGALPGVSSIMSLLPFPVVRGSSPGNTGFLIDGVRVPLLFHLLAGPSVIHPELIDQIDFYPGAFPVEYGGYTAGIVDGRTRSAGPDERRAEVDINFFQAGGLLRAPIPWIGWTGTVAGRYGYPGLLISLASPRVSLGYWDYQARFDQGDATSGATVFVFGARDAFDSVPDGLPDDAEKERVFLFEFHRVDLRYRHRTGDLRGDYQLTLGYDESLARDDATLGSFNATQESRWLLEVAPGLELAFGADGFLKQADFDVGETGSGAAGDLLGTGTEPEDLVLTGGFFVEALLRPSERLLLRPGFRIDGTHNTEIGHLGFDPRLLARFRLSDEAPRGSDAAEIWLKGGVGLYHQPPRFAVPLPGLDQLAFSRGLLEAVQATAGAELILAGGYSVDVATYFNWMDPIFFDVQVNPDVEDVQQSGPDAPPGVAPPEPPRDDDGLDDRLDQILNAAVGRSYGVELMLRRTSRTGVTGWISYTLSRSERRRDGEWTAFDFDRTHILNLVLGMPLPRNWQLGVRAQLQTGRPLTTTRELSGARASTFVRWDLRIDKTAVWNDWLLDFYVDISNAVLAAEELAPENQLRYVLPTVGFRGSF